MCLCTPHMPTVGAAPQVTCRSGRSEAFAAHRGRCFFLAAVDRRGQNRISQHPPQYLAQHIGGMQKHRS